MATLAEVIRDALVTWRQMEHVERSTLNTSLHQYIAAAVAARLTSPEVLHEARKALADHIVCTRVRPCLDDDCTCRAEALCVIRAALGEHEGVGRG